MDKKELKHYFQTLSKNLYLDLNDHVLDNLVDSWSKTLETLKLVETIDTSETLVSNNLPQLKNYALRDDKPLPLKTPRESLQTFKETENGLAKIKNYEI